MNPRPWGLLFVGVMVAGCFHGGPPLPTSPWTPLDGVTEGCISGNCLANSSSKDYQRVLERYNLTQITQGDGAFFVELDGNHLVWQDVERVREAATHAGDEPRDQIWLFDFNQGALVPLDADSCFHRTNPVLAPQRVTFTSIAHACAPDEEYRNNDDIVWWDLQTRTRHVERTGLNGSIVQGFDGQWLLYRITYGDDARRGFWVRNVEDGRQYQLYTFPPYYFDLSGNLTEVIFGTNVVGGRAYVSFYRQNLTHEPGYGIVTESTIMEWDLENGTSRAFGVYRGQITYFDVSDKYVAWAVPRSSDSATVYYANRTGDGTRIQVSLFEEAEAIFPKVGGDWIVYQVQFAGGESGQESIVGYHVPSKTRATLFQGGLGWADAGTFDTDGERIVMNVYRGSLREFETVGNDLYWRFLPDVSASVSP